MEPWLHWVDLAGVAVFAIAGTLMAYKKHMDGFGVVVLASVTAIGGGTLRDMILDLPIFLMSSAYRKLWLTVHFHLSPLY
jgi:uncharacterized membrane protein YeiH